MPNQKSFIHFKILLIILLFIALLTTLCLIWKMYYEQTDQPSVENGVLDLSEWEFTDNKTITLNGKWNFYPHEFMDELLQLLTLSLMFLVIGRKRWIVMTLFHRAMDMGVIILNTVASFIRSSVSGEYHKVWD